MGLCLVCKVGIADSDVESQGVAYCDMHSLRVVMTALFLRVLYTMPREPDDYCLDTWFSALGASEEMPNTIQEYNSFLLRKLPLDGTPDYESWPDTFAIPWVHPAQVSAVAARYGLGAFCNHSDCDGVHSPGQVRDIVRLFEFIRQPAEEISRSIKRARCLPEQRKERFEDLLDRVKTLDWFYGEVERVGGYVVFARREEAAVVVTMVAALIPEANLFISEGFVCDLPKAASDGKCPECEKLAVRVRMPVAGYDPGRRDFLGMEVVPFRVDGSAYVLVGKRVCSLEGGKALDRCLDLNLRDRAIVIEDTLQRHDIAPIHTGLYMLDTGKLEG